ncbi:hypothetical protein GUJ93_ZPchr0011g28241 [Zizania palustris]|uniref:Uncharacterized protein n=1 Tax=Zizania palustris TaxID=103762 RepID=A0A8J5WLJ1_ZIZPA|nr:hypothetical protein GUJ93_ZPchr0011g28241 [Zizania palustris]
MDIDPEPSSSPFDVAYLYAVFDTVADDPNGVSSAIVAEGVTSVIVIGVDILGDVAIGSSVSTIAADTTVPTNAAAGAPSTVTDASRQEGRVIVVVH